MKASLMPNVHIPYIMNFHKQKQYHILNIIELWHSLEKIFCGLQF